MMYDRFRVDIIGDLDTEDLVADIYFDDQILAEITQEEGLHNLKIKIYPSKDFQCWNFRFDEFEKTILHAKNRLWQLRKNK